MKLITDSKDNLINEIYSKIANELANNRTVVFFVSGGSALETEAIVLSKITQAIKNPRLIVVPVDERYGTVGHANSNIANFKKLLSPESSALVIDILENVSLATTRNNFENIFKQYISAKYISVALLGIGQDGHTAGILGGSSAESSPRLVESYASTPHTRLTLTKNALSKIDHVYVSAYGQDKKNILQELFYKKTIKPMGILKDLNEVKVYTDNIINEVKL